MHARGVRAVELPLVLEAADAKRLAEVLLFAAWVERTTLATSVPPRYLRLDPADPVTIAAVVRTLSATSPAVEYSAAEQTADFGAPQAAVTVRVFQLSEAVGRGFPAEATL